MSSDFGIFLDALPERQVMALAGIDIRLENEPHPFETENRLAIDAHWASEAAANPALFNGRMVLPFSVWLENGVLRGESRPIDFATFLYWRRRAERPDGVHIFAHAVPISSDNAIVAVRMGQHTANPGRVYCAAGSFEPGDFTGGRMDFERNTHREVLEETGLDLGAAAREKDYGLLRAARSVLVFRRYFLPYNAAAIERMIATHVENDPEPEIDGAVIIREGIYADNMAAHMKTLIDWHFATGRT